MAPPNGESEAASWVVAEPCTMPVGTKVHTTALESTLYLEEVTPQLAGPSGTRPGRFSPVGAGAKMAVTALFLTARSWPRNE